MQIDINGWGICAMKMFVEQFSMLMGNVLV